MKNLLSLLLLASSYMYSMDSLPTVPAIPKKERASQDKIKKMLEFKDRYNIDTQTYLTCIKALSEHNDSSQVGPMLGHVDADYRVLAAMSFFGYFDVTKNNIYRTN